MSKLQILITLSLATQLCRAQHDSYRIYEIFSSAGTMELGGDGFGARTITAEEVSFNGCADWAQWPTGTETGNRRGMEESMSELTTLSLISQPTGGLDKTCIIQNSTADGQQSVWSSMRGIKVTTPRWRFIPRVTVTDVDMEGDGAIDPNNADLYLRKSAIVVGFVGDKLVRPRWTLYTSQLFLHNMTLAANELGRMGVQRPSGASESVPGLLSTWAGEAPRPPPLTCARNSGDMTCGGLASFGEPVDGFFVLVALERGSRTQAGALVSVGEVQVPEGCRCSRGKRRRRVFEETVDGSSECVTRHEAEGYYFCTPQGGAWCERFEYTRWTITGPRMPSGAWPCTGTQAIGARFLYETALAAK